jgi:hypothetical protein
VHGWIGYLGLPGDSLEVPRPVLFDSLDDSEVCLVESGDYAVDPFEVLSGYRSGQV